MRAITVQPGKANSARLDHFPDPKPDSRSLLVRARLITRRVPLDDFVSALDTRHDDIKVIIDFTERHGTPH